ncbi:cupin domain-containing protein [Phenylobacterium sp.]|uniref:cupin domain-containing protein n=1 Tax=Phenylobacterium sp. TaxID=1871053 RepID=UPI002F94D288
MKAYLIIAAVVAATPAAAQAPAPVSRQISAQARTMSGQPILLPQGPVQVTYTETVVPPGGALPPHKHPYPRYALVMSGRLKVTNLVTGTVSEVKAGELAIDAIDQWHEAVVLGAEPVRMLVIDQAPPGVVNTVRRDP